MNSNSFSHVIKRAIICLSIALCLSRVAYPQEVEEVRAPADVTIPQWVLPAGAVGAATGITAALSWGLAQKRKCAEALGQLAQSKVENIGLSRDYDRVETENIALKRAITNAGLKIQRRTNTPPPEQTPEEKTAPSGINVRDGRVPKPGPIPATFTGAELDQLMNDLITRETASNNDSAPQSKTQQAPPETNTHIRWMIRRDMGEILSIEKRSFTTEWSEPWTEADFITALRDRGTIGMIAEQNEKVVGFMVYKLGKDRLELLNFAVDPSFSRTGVGTDMVDKLKTKLSPHARPNLYADVSEYNLAAQQFFISQGFHFTRSVKDGDGDAYRFKYQVPIPPQAADNK